MTKAYLEASEVEHLEKAAANLRDRLLIKLLLRLGCRISEALGLQVQDIDFARSTVTIQHLKSRLKLSCTECKQRLGRNHMFCPKCGGKVEKAGKKEYGSAFLFVDDATNILSGLGEREKPSG